MCNTAALPKVLVVEDEALLLFAIGDELRAAGYEVLEARTADEAIALLETNPEITLLFTDVDMPGSMDGVKLSAAVRRRWPPIKIVVTSGKQRPKADELPADSVFVPKPYTLAAVRAAFATQA